MVRNWAVLSLCSAGMALCAYLGISLISHFRALFDGS
jgi:hypothetical protein